MRTCIVHSADWISTCFRIGYLPLAPGTWGSLAAVFAWRLLPEFRISHLTLLVVLVFFTGVVSSSILVNREKIKDPSHIVIDEWVGMWLALLFIPNEWVWIVIAFALFRFFDIIKIYPANRFEELSGGWGIMMDDIVAGFYSGVMTKSLVLFL